MRVAALDLGTNTFLMLIADIDLDEAGKKNITVLSDQMTVTRLGQEVDKTRRFHKDALKRAEECLRKYSKKIEENHVDQVIAVATSAARDVENRDEFFQLGKRCGIPIRVIGGDLEAELTFKGASLDLTENEHVVVVDVGGGSTEIIGRQNDKIKGYSFDVGSVRLTEKFVQNDEVTADEIQKMERFIHKKIDAETLLFKSFGGANVLAVAGTPTTLACLINEKSFDEKDVHGQVLTANKIKEVRNHLATLKLSEREKLPGMDPKRADVIVGGATVLLSFLRELGEEKLTVSTRGVRYGVALECEKILSLPLF